MKATANPKVAVESQDASVDAIVRFATPPMRVFIPLITPFLYGMERAVIEIFDSLRPEVEPHFLQSNRIYQRRPPIIDEMEKELASQGLADERFTVRMTGCPNGCARPYNADIGLVGRSAEKNADGPSFPRTGSTAARLVK